MFPYLVVFAICLFLNWRSSSKKILPILLSCLILSLMAGFRDLSVGADTDYYPHWYISALRNIKNFPDIVNLETNLDKGFLFLYWVGSWLSDQYWIGLFLVELLITTFTFWGYFRLSKHFGNSIFFFTFAFLFLIYNYTLNAMRQECAISIMFLAFSYLIEKRWITCFFWTFVAYTFHASAIVFAIIPVMLYVSSIENIRKRKTIFFIFICLGILGTVSLFTLVKMIGELGILNANHFNAYAEDGKFEGANHVPIVPSFFCIMIYYYIYLSIAKGIVDMKIAGFLFLVNTFYLLSLCLSLVSIYLYRVGLCFYLIDIYLFSVILSSKKTNNFLRIIAICYFLGYWFYLYNVQKSSETIPYTSEILGIN